MRPAPPPITRSMVSGRNIGIDLLRVISVSAVVVGHGWPGMPGEEYLQIWRMPLFFFLAGYFFSTHRGFFGELGVRWRTLGIPYVVWLVVLVGVVAAHSLTPRPFENTWGTIAGAFFGGGLTDMPFLAFWFISVLFFAALLVRILVRFPWWLQLAAAVAGLALAQLPHSAMSYTVLGIGLAPACAAYMLSGWWFRKLIRSPGMGTFTGSAWAGVVGMALVAAGMTGVALGAGTMNMKWSGFGTFLLSPGLAVLICMGLALVFGTWVDWALRRSAGLTSVVSSVVATGTLVVFLHPYILFLMWHLAPVPPVRIVVALVVCWILGLMVNRTWLSPYLTGLPRPTQHWKAA